jgi:hypothetical protein
MYLDMGMLYVLLWGAVAIGIFYSAKKYGSDQYSEGVADAIVMHYSGTLTYKIILNEDGEEDIEIKIHKE